MANDAINKTLSVDGVVADTSRTPTRYIMTVGDDAGHVWEVSRRYNEFFMLREQLLAILSVEHDCTGCCGTARIAITFNFPRKRLLTSRTLRVVQHRTQALMAFICQLLDCTNGILFKNCAYVLETNVLGIIEKFLNADQLADPSLAKLGIVAFGMARIGSNIEGQRERYLRIKKKTLTTSQSAKLTEAMSRVQPVTEEEAKKLREVDVDLCQICLDDGDLTDVVRLLCGHTFHRVCLVEWLERTLDCPSCREPVTPAAGR